MKVKKATDVVAIPVEMEGARGVAKQVLIHHEDGAPNFYMRQFTIAPDGHTPHHSHDWEHEVYIIGGMGLVARHDGHDEIAVGDCVYVAPNEPHQFRNTGEDELTFLCMIPKNGL